MRTFGIALVLLFASLSASASVLNVKTDCGAAGNGSTDDTTAIQNCINSLGDTTTMRGGEIYFPSGTYVISATIVIDRKSAYIHGSGFGRGVTTANGTVIKWNGVADEPMFQITRCWGLKVEGFRFVGKSTAKPSSAIELYAGSGDSPVNTKIALSWIWVGNYGGFDTSEGFKDGITTAGTNAQNDQSSMEHIFVVDFDRRGIALVNTQNVIWRLSHLVLNSPNTGAVGLYLATRHVMVDNAFFQSNDVDIEIASDGVVELSNIGSELGGRFINAASGASVGVRGGYWQCGSSQHSDGKIVNVTSGGGNFRFDSFVFTDAGTASSAKFYARGSSVAVSFVRSGLPNSAATFFDLGTTTTGDKRRLEVTGQSSGNFVNEWVHGQSPDYSSTSVASLAQDGWTSMSLQNGWSNYGSGHATAQYFKDKNGMVHLKGSITGGTTTDGTVIATLPAGYRPSEILTIKAWGTDIAIRTSGNIEVNGTSGATISLSNISFRP